jgi:hypothetical protein
MRRGTTNETSGQCRGQIASRQRWNQQRCATYRTAVSIDNVSQLADTCNQIRKLCKDRVFKRTEHSNIMEYLRTRADRFWRNGRLHREEMEEIIAKLKRAEEERGDGDIESNVRMAEYAPHVTLPNTKRNGIFQLLCKNPNGLNNQITGNHKLSMAIDIKDELEADGLLYSEHRLNLRHKDYKNNLKQMFQWEVACKAIAAHNVHHGVSRVQEGGTGMVAFGNTTG